uniref:Protein HGH1 homolog n=1 Tax=Blastobotrys adeninivorans TaxID=409370 RepID=A0A060T8C6_BLAAD
MSTELQELVGFLGAPMRLVRQLAVQNLVQYSQGEHAYVFRENDHEPIRNLKALTKDGDPRTVRHALTILVNLCNDPSILDLLAGDDKFVEHIGNSICDLREVNPDLFCILLANLAKNDSVTSVFNMKRTKPTASRAQKKSEDEASMEQQDTEEDKQMREQLAMEPIDDSDIFKSDMMMDCLLDCFVKGHGRDLNKFGNFDYLAFFFSDVSRFKAGREYFVKKDTYDNVIPVTKLLVFTSYKSRIRRTGVASTIKNCLFDLDTHENFVKNEDINLLPYILLPLADASDEYREDELFELPDELQLLPPDKKREPELEIVKTMVESLLLLCTKREMREYLRLRSFYPVIRELHKNVEEDEIRQLSERLVQMLMGDEEPQPKVQEIDNNNNNDDDDDEDVVAEVV